MSRHAKNVPIIPATVALFFVAACGQPSITSTSTSSQPSDVRAIAGNGRALVMWSAPQDASHHVIGYVVTASPDIAPVLCAGATSVVVSGLSDGTPYTFFVRAQTTAGDGPESEPSTAVTPANGPGAPFHVTTMPGIDEVTVTWAVPLSDGGEQIQSYVVTASPGGQTAESDGTSARIGGLTPGASYTFTVYARNAADRGPASAPSAPAVPLTNQVQLTGPAIGDR